MGMSLYAASPRSVAAQTNNSNAHIKSVTAITEVFGEGQKITAAAVEYDKEIDSSKLLTSTFSVEGRTITKVYANNAPAKAAQGINGQYAIIELSTADANAAVLALNMGAQPPADAQNEGTPPANGTPNAQGGGGPGRMSITRNEVKLSVTQAGDITTTDGEKYAAAPQAVVSDKVINVGVDDFQQLEFNDPKYGKTLMYNLYVPKNYDKNKSYPLVLFMPDASATSTDHDRTLIQGIGGVIWATPAEQAKHESFVLAPQYTVQTVSDNSEATDELDITVDLIHALAGQYNIDKNRIYTTGQSGGCMMSIAMDIKYPDLFAASLLVAGQWDAAKVAPMANDKLWIIVSEGDQKAFPGMNAITAALEKEGAKVSRATWSGLSTPAEFAAEVGKMVAEDSNIKYTVLQKGTVVPAGQPDDPGSNHINTWRIAYTIEGVRDWLFAQSKWTPVKSVDFSSKHTVLIKNDDGATTPMDVPYFESKLIAPGTWQILSDGDYFYLVEGDNEAVVIDTGYGAGNVREYLQTLTTKPIKNVVNTHYHFDHTAGDVYFDAVYMSAETQAKATMPYPSFDGIAFPRNYPTVIIGEGYRYQLGNRDLEVFDIPNHTEGGIALLDRKERILFSGDEIMGFGIRLNISVAQFEKNMAKLAAHRSEFDTLCGGPGVMDAALIDKYLANARYILSGQGTPTKVQPRTESAPTQTDPSAPIVYTRGRVRPGDGGPPNTNEFTVSMKYDDSTIIYDSSHIN